MALYLQLKLGSLTVRFKGAIFEDGELPRAVDPELAGETTYSNEGGVSVSGSSFHPKHLWTWAVATRTICVTQPDLPDQVRELWSEYDRLRRARLNPQIELEDGTQYFFENTPRTRALATDASEIATSTGRIKYYSKYYVTFARPPVFQQGEGFTIQLAEGDIFSA
ncbi:hypothetical protein N836_31360 [Leptolyngbya sp. Heron Island J]|uniref:hypothetical protein n=1 Tax=Leptolyngbya sp. Heron Island J TaxID=1385935 RepID=UPI0003B9BBBE|nr:hypothetical protein [Leptolyngbya sp. Heron Island J]ESA38440.1 hypothetical protein N836_31360 [Leptolyngbya sp. Heron Island J]